MYSAILSVIPLLYVYCSGAHTRNTLNKQLSSYRPDLFKGIVNEKTKLGLTLFHNFIVGFLHLFGLHPCPVDLGEKLFQRYKRVKGMSVFSPLNIFAVGELCNTAEYAYGEFLSTYRAEALFLQRFQRIQPYTTFSMAIVVILALLRKELNRSPKAFPIGFQCRHD